MTFTKPKSLEEFDIEKYAALETFGHQKWAELIESRFLCRLLIESGNSVTEAESDSPNPFAHTVNLLIEHFLDTPLTPLPYSARKVLEKVDKRASVVSKTKVIDILALNRAAIEVIPFATEIGDDQAVATNQAQAAEDPIDDVIKRSQSYKVRNLARVTVDLQASDEKILGDFKNVLALYRNESQPAPPTITETKLTQWARNKVLPYADLMLWSLWSGVQLAPNDLMDLLLSHDEREKTHPLRSTIHDYAQAVSRMTVAVLTEKLSGTSKEH